MKMLFACCIILGLVSAPMRSQAQPKDPVVLSFVVADLVSSHRVESRFFYDKTISGGRNRVVTATPRATTPGMLLEMISPWTKGQRFSHFQPYPSKAVLPQAGKRMCLGYTGKPGSQGFRIDKAWAEGSVEFRTHCASLLPARQ